MSTILKAVSFGVILLWAKSAYAHPPDSCQCDTVEHGFGAPYAPIDFEFVSRETYVALQDSLQSKQTDSDLLYKLGYLAMELGELDSAIEYFEQSRIQDNFQTPYFLTYLNNYLGDIYVEKNEFAKARECYIESGDPYYIHLIDARIYEEQGEVNLAIAELLKAQQVRLYEGSNIEPYRLVAELFLRQKWYDFAAYWATKYLYEMELESINPEAMWGFTEKAFDAAHELLERIDSAKVAEDSQFNSPSE